MTAQGHPMHPRIRRLAACCVALLCMSAPEAGESVTVFAAASTADALGEIAKAYEAASAIRVVGSYAASSALAKQIEQGAPADLFISADRQWMDRVQAKGLVRPASRRDLLGNVLVLVTPKARPLELRVEPGFDLARAFTGRLAIGDPASVPAGTYAQEAFTRLGWWASLKDRLAPAADVRAALRLVELGEADLGVVYATDAKRSDKVVVAATVPAELHAPVRYPAALTVEAKPAAAAFLAWLAGPEAAAIWARHGFTPLGAARAIPRAE